MLRASEIAAMAYMEVILWEGIREVEHIAGRI